jgi:hypothetical protein
MKKIFLAVGLLAMAYNAQAIAVYPNETPLQPAPANTHPNYSGNFQSGEGIEPGQQGNTTQEEIEQGEYTEEDEAAAEQNKVEAKNYGGVDSFPLMAGVAIVLISAAVSWGYYKVRTRAMNKKV